MVISEIPGTLEEVFREFRTCELSTLTRGGAPVTWPVTALYQPAKRRFLITTSIGLPQKAFNIRRNPKVSLLFSEPTGSGLSDPPAVLVQGDAEAEDELIREGSEFDELARLVFRRQPAGELYSRNPFTQRLFDWYYIRLGIRVVPRRILWWDRGDFTRAPLEVEAEHVE